MFSKPEIRTMYNRRGLLKFCQASLRSSRSISSSSSAQKMRQIRDDSPLIVKEDRQTTSLASHDSGGAASGKRENENDFLFFRDRPSLRTFSQENGKSNAENLGEGYFLSIRTGGGDSVLVLILPLLLLRRSVGVF